MHLRELFLIFCLTVFNKMTVISFAGSSQSPYTAAYPAGSLHESLTTRYRLYITNSFILWQSDILYGWLLWRCLNRNIVGVIHYCGHSWRVFQSRSCHCLELRHSFCNTRRWQPCLCILIPTLFNSLKKTSHSLCSEWSLIRASFVTFNLLMHVILLL